MHAQDAPCKLPMSYQHRMWNLTLAHAFTFQLIFSPNYRKYTDKQKAKQSKPKKKVSVGWRMLSLSLSLPFIMPYHTLPTTAIHEKERDQCKQGSIIFEKGK